MNPDPLTKKSLAEAARYLAARDNDLARLLEIDGVPPLWARKPCFSTLIHIILEQQVSLASAMAMYHRLVDNLVPFTPKRFLEVGSSYLRSLGVTRQKAAYCINVAEAILVDQLDLKAVSRMDDLGAVETLVKKLQKHPSLSTLSKVAEAWRPFRSVAARMLWHHYLSARTQGVS